MTDLTKIKDRIAKLLAKANNNSNEHEAQLAMSRARRLMDEHQLDEMDISVAADAEMFGEEMDDSVYAYTPKWREWIATQCAKLNDCQCMKVAVEAGGNAKNGQRLPNKTKLKWRGFKSDVMLAKAMYKYLCDVIDASTSEYMKAQGHTRYNARLGTIFKEAMADRIVQRMYIIEADRKEAGTESPTGMGLVLYKAAQVAEHFGVVKYKEAKDVEMEAMNIEELTAHISGSEKGSEVAITNVLEGA